MLLFVFFKLFCLLFAFFVCVLLNILFMHFGWLYVFCKQPKQKQKIFIKKKLCVAICLLIFLLFCLYYFFLQGFLMCFFYIWQLFVVLYWFALFCFFVSVLQALLNHETQDICGRGSFNACFIIFSLCVCIACLFFTWILI